MARRVNTKFLVIFTVIIAGLLIALLLANRLGLLKGNPDKLIHQGDVAVQEGRLNDALDSYGSALNARQNDIETRLKVADIYIRQSTDDAEAFGKAMQWWNSILQIDPKNAPALTKMLEAQLALLREGMKTPDNYKHIMDNATRLLEADPGNYKALVLQQTMTLQGWMSGMAISDSDLAEASKQLNLLLEKNPTDPDILQTLGSFMIWKVRQSKDTAEVRKTANDVIAMVDKAMASPDAGASTMFRCAGLLANTLNAVPADQSKAVQERFKKLVFDAANTVKDDNTDMPDILLAAANVAAIDGNLPESDRYLNMAMTKLPDRQSVRITVARMMAQRGGDSRLKALAMLEKPVGKDVLLGQSLRVTEIITRSERAQLRLDIANDDAIDAKIRNDQKSKLRDEYAALSKVRNEKDPEMLRLLGRIELLEGKDLPSAIQHMEAANTALKNNNKPDFQLMLHLARAYAMAGQSGKSRDLLEYVVSKMPGDPRLRIALAQQYFAERNIKAAESQIKAIAELAPNEPRLLSLRLQLLSLQNKPEEMVTLLRAVPETELPQMLAKAQLAMQLNLMDESQRLLKLAKAKDPNSEDVDRLQIDLYMRTNRQAEAIALLEPILKAHPDDPSLKMLMNHFSVTSIEQAKSLRKAEAESIADPFDKAMALARMYRDFGEIDSAISQLETATSLHPDRMDAQAELFAIYVQTGNVAKAEPMVDMLAKANADQAHGLVVRFRMAMAKRDYTTARQMAQSMVRDMPEFSLSWLCLGQSLQSDGEYEDAIQRYQRALEGQPVNEIAYRGIIESYYLLQRPQDARQAIDKALSVMPNSPIFKELQLRWKQGYGNPEEALADRRESYKASPDKRDALIQLAQNLQQTAGYRQRKGDSSGAKTFLQEAATDLKAGIEKWPDEVSLYVLLRDVYLQNSMPKEAEETVLLLRKNEKMNASGDVDMLLADMYARQGLPTEAERAFRVAIVKAENKNPLLVKLSQYLAMTGHPERAIEALPDSDDPLILAERARLQVTMQMLPEAEATLATLLKKTPDSTDGMSLLGFVYLLEKRYPEAEATLNQILSRDSSNATALLNRARVYLDKPQTDIKAAIKDLILARSINGQDIDIRMTLVNAYRRRNDINAAVSELVAVSDMQPGNKVARLQLIQIFSSTKPMRRLELEKLLRETLAMPQYAKDPDFILAHANLLQRTGNTDKALEAVQSAIKDSPNSGVLYRGYMDLLMTSRRFKDLLDRSADMAANPEKGAWWIYELRGKALHRLDRTSEALTELDKGLSTPDAKKSPAVEISLINTMGTEISPDEAVKRIGDRINTDPDWQLIASQLYLIHGTFSKAIDLIQTVEKGYDKLSDNQRVTFLRLAAQVYTDARPSPNPEKARDYYLKLLALYPNDLPTLNNLAFILVDNLQQPDQAVVYSQRAVDQMAAQGIDEPMVRDTQGWVLVHMPSRYDEGINMLRDLADKNPSAEVYVHLGVGLMIQDNFAGAEAYLRKASDAMDEDTATGHPVDPALKLMLEKAKLDLADNRKDGK